MAEVTMPRLSDTMEQGTVAKWLKREGERVTKGEPLVEIETDKANMVLDSYESGVLERIVVAEGRTVPIGEPIAYIAAEREAAAKPSAPAAAAPPSAPAAPAAPAPSGAAPAAPRPEAAPGEEQGRLKVSPIARRIAQEHDVDLAKLTGTGPGGRITREDVENYMRERPERRAQAAPAPAAPAPAPPPVAAPAPAAGPAAAETESVPLTRMQATIARRMVESKTAAPHFYTTSEIGMDAALDLRREINATLGGEAQVGVNDLILRAAALALRKFPEVNASFGGGAIEYHKRINVGIAVALPQGLVVPVLRDADRKSLVEIAREAKELVEKARHNRLAPAEWEGGTFTVSNLGMYDVEEFAAIITPPQSAIMAVGSIKPTPVVIDEEIKIARRMKATLSADHRVFYGAMAAEFLQEVKRLLEDPLSLLL